MPAVRGLHAFQRRARFALAVVRHRRQAAPAPVQIHPAGNSLEAQVCHMLVAWHVHRSQRTGPATQRCPPLNVLMHPVRRCVSQDS